MSADTFKPTTNLTPAQINRKGSATPRFPGAPAKAGKGTGVEGPKSPAGGYLGKVPADTKQPQ
jgi:hypothetical protein